MIDDLPINRDNADNTIFITDNKTKGRFTFNFDKEVTRYPQNIVSNKFANCGGSSRTVRSAEGERSAGDLKVLYTNADSLLNKSRAGCPN